MGKNEFWVVAEEFSGPSNTCFIVFLYVTLIHNQAFVRGTEMRIYFYQFSVIKDPDYLKQQLKSVEK